jgi:hypothetical protein
MALLHVAARSAASITVAGWLDMGYLMWDRPLEKRKTDA